MVNKTPYQEGYMNGHLDRFMCLEPSRYSLICRFDWGYYKEYGQGYYDGYYNIIHD